MFPILNSQNQTITVNLSRTDIEKGLSVPEFMTHELAEEMGIHTGDGYLSIKKSIWGTKYIYEIASSKKERDYIDNILVPLYKKIYNLNLHIRNGHSCLGCYATSKGLCEFKRSIGFPIGRKDNIQISGMLFGSPYIFDFLRGLFDTDGYLRFVNRNKKARPYPRLDITSKSKKLIYKVGEVLKVNGFTFSITRQLQNHYLTNTPCETWRIFLYGAKNFSRWERLIGFSNPKNIQKITEWKATGGI